MQSTVEVKLSERSYPIWIGTGMLAEQLALAYERIPNWKHAVLIADQSVSPIADQVAEALTSKGIRCDVNGVPSGESSKSVDQLSRLWDAMLDQRADRKSVVVAIGGGVIGDLAGFVAGSYMRGVRFVQIPTTLLAMVDSSVGGKTGINLPKSKNMVGAFWQPHAVCIDTTTLQSLPDREYLSGLAEVVKYGVILDLELFEYLEAHAESLVQRAPTAVEYIVRRSCELKAAVVAADERETTGLRAILNYGHTFGHAIEARTSYGRYLHGEAVAIGMSMAGELAKDLSLWSNKELIRQTVLLKRLGLPVTLKESISTEDLLSAMQLDKKTENGVLNLILPTCLGHVEVRSNIAQSAVSAAIDHCR
jgi:3-dehydroquinate synthase